jgi:hypothetical protein
VLFDIGVHAQGLPDFIDYDLLFSLVLSIEIGRAYLMLNKGGRRPEDCVFLRLDWKKTAKIEARFGYRFVCPK